MAGYVLFGGAMSGAVAVEAALTLAGAAYEVVDAFDEADPARLAQAGPMRQVPALVFPSGERMTESAAILVRLAELHPQARLGPGPEDSARGQFLRWMSFVSSAIYAHYWLKDDPSRLVADASLHADVNARIEQRILDCWAVMEGEAEPGRYIVSEAPSVLDLYVTVVSRFRPRRTRFYAAAPRLGEVVRRVDADPRLADLWARRYPFFDGWEDPPAD
jgi:GST-like protein